MTRPRHRHKVKSETTIPGSGVYVARCRCGATRLTIFRGAGEFVEPKKMPWAVAESTQVKP